MLPGVDIFVAHKRPSVGGMSGMICFWARMLRVHKFDVVCMCCNVVREREHASVRCFVGIGGWVGLGSVGVLFLWGVSLGCFLAAPPRLLRNSPATPPQLLRDSSSVTPPRPLRDPSLTPPCEHLIKNVGSCFVLGGLIYFYCHCFLLAVEHLHVDLIPAVRHHAMRRGGGSHVVVFFARAVHRCCVGLRVAILS